MKTTPKVQVPVYFISGKYDYNTPWPLVEQYYQTFKAHISNLSCLRSRAIVLLLKSLMRSINLLLMNSAKAKVKLPSGKGSLLFNFYNW
jgi:hypothetical protein